MMNVFEACLCLGDLAVDAAGFAEVVEHKMHDDVEAGGHQ